MNPAYIYPAYLRDRSGARARGLEPADRTGCLAVRLDELPPLRPVEGLHVLGRPDAFDLARGTGGGSMGGGGGRAGERWGGGEGGEQELHSVDQSAQTVNG